MADKQSKSYIKGGGKAFKFDNGGEIVNLYIDIEDARKIGAIKKSEKTGKEYLYVTVEQRRSPSDWGDTHSLSYREYRKGGGSSSKPVSKKKDIDFDDDSDDLPF